MTPPMPANNPKQPEVTQGYTPAEIEFLQKLMDRYSEGGGIIDLAEDHRAFMGVVRAYRIAAERATRERVLEEAARKAEHSCYDYANTIEPSINDDGSKAFGFGFDYACEVIAAAIRALQEPKV